MFRPKRKRKQLSQLHDTILSLAVKHDDGHLELAELSDALPAHAAGAGRRGDVRSHGDGLEGALGPGGGEGFPEGDALGAGGHGVRGVLDVGARDVGPGDGEENGTDAEVAVGAVGERFGLHGAGVEGGEFIGMEVKGSASLEDVFFGGGGEDRGGGGRHFFWWPREGLVEAQMGLTGRLREKKGGEQVGNGSLELGEKMNCRFMS